jgi:hypothetical protein
MVTNILQQEPMHKTATNTAAEALLEQIRA